MLAKLEVEEIALFTINHPIFHGTLIRKQYFKFQMLFLLNTNRACENFFLTVTAQIKTYYCREVI